VKKKILIHIGMGRCGSTSIQYALRLKRSELAARGIHYPETKPNEDGHHVLGLLSDDKIEEAERAWRDVLSEFDKSGYHTLLLSTEMFIAIPTKLFQTVRRLISGYSVNVIFIVRNQKELLPSTYAQWIKARIAFRSFEHFYRVTNQEWHFTRIIERWENAFGAENIRCGVITPKADAVQIFAECCGGVEISEVLKNTRIRINAGMNPSLLPFLVFFDRFNSRNKIGSVFPGWNLIEPSRPDRNADLRTILVEFLERQTNGKIGKGRWDLGKKMLNLIDAEYQKSNWEFHARYLAHESPDWMGNRNGNSFVAAELVGENDFTKL
jgi:hypothetical protein